ncbi:MAG: hypothetical protein COB42_02335 [Sulfurimonas sp.]|nr:MAG: hypothetical protein COB42_02335 [Sulfurimonas sp.]
MLSREFKNNLNHLKPYKVYSFADLNEFNKDSLSVIINRLANSGEIIKIGKGKFYRRKKSEMSKKKEGLELNKYKPQDPYSIRHNRIKPSSIPIFKSLFYSNRNNFIPLDNFISRVLYEDSLVMSEIIVRRFGSSRVLEVYLNNFRRQGKIQNNIEELLNV